LERGGVGGDALGPGRQRPRGVFGGGARGVAQRELLLASVVNAALPVILVTIAPR
jgi:hypothetical protein